MKFGLAITCAAAAVLAAMQQPVAPLAPAQRVPLCANDPTCPWPAESPSSAIDLTSIEGPGTNDFHVDMSGAFWNPYQQVLWVCRNGGSGGSKVWKLVQRGASSFQVGTVAGQRAEWSGFGDCEALALGSFAEPETVFTLDESTNSVKEWDLAAPSAVLKRTWNLGAHVPTYASGLGLEGLAFVPDAALASGDFVDASGVARTSTQGMGALAFVAHQNGGRVYVFDLNRANGTFQFVGEYATSGSETAELCFDPSLGALYAWHGAGVNDLEVLRLRSVAQGSIRRFERVLTYDAPGGANDEGFALQWGPSDCVEGRRGAFVLTDGGGAQSLRWYRQFVCGF